MTDSFEALYRFAPCGLLSSTTDGAIIEVNDTLLELTGFTREQLLGVTFASLLDQGSAMFYETRHLPVLRLKGEVREVVLTLRRAGGDPMHVLVTSTYTASGIETALFDATERTAYERTLLEARRLSDSTYTRLRVLQAATAQFASGDTAESVSEALAASAHEALDASFTAVTLLDDAGVLRISGGRHPDLTPHGSSTETPAQRAMRLGEAVAIASPEDGAESFPEVAVGMRAARIESLLVVPLFDGDRALGVLVTSFLRRRVFDQPLLELQAALARQAVEALVRLRLQRQLEALAHYDQLTGLLNRQFLRGNLTGALARAESEGEPLGVLFLDLDGFKAVNDHFGHRAGDAVLNEVGRRLTGALRSDDIVGRLGGDEFVVVCPGLGRDDAVRVGELIGDVIRAPFDGVPPAMQITASIGIDVYEPGAGHAASTDDMLSRADDAMYAAKNAGKDRAAFASAQN